MGIADTGQPDSPWFLFWLLFKARLSVGDAKRRKAGEFPSFNRGKRQETAAPRIFVEREITAEG
jgi:hypothetical protein